MKTTIKHSILYLAVLGFSLVFTSCSKDDDDDEETSYRSALIGTWQQIQYSYIDKENGEIVFSKDMTDEQIENLQKLKDAQEFMKTDEGKKLAESMLNQQMDISKGQRKWLKKQGIDADAFVQEWNRQNPDSTNNKKFTKEKAEVQ